MTSRELLRAKHLSVTAVRLKVLDCLQDGTHFHAIADLSAHLANLNVKSLYNSIKALVAAGLIDSYTFNGVSKYALSDAALGVANAAHIIYDNEQVSHITLDKRIFSEITTAVQAKNLTVRAIKIFIDVTALD